MITALLPSRGRPDSLARSINSLLTLADDPGGVEVMVGADQDDPATHQMAGSLGVRLVGFDYRHGYANLHHYYNVLARCSTGDWIMVWNDDALMTTQDWDARIEELPPEVIVADLQSQHSPDLCTFPAVRRRAVEIVGAYSPHISHADTYWQDIGRALGRIRPVDVHVHHDRHDLTGGHNDQTWRESKGAQRTHEYYSERIQALIRADIEKLRGALS